MVTKTKDPFKCKKIDALRIKKYTGCCIYKNRSLPMKDFVANAKAPVEHLFNDHQWCHEDWCWAKGLQNQAHKFICKIASTSVVTVALTHPPTTTTDGDGVQMPSATEVVNPAVGTLPDSDNVAVTAATTHQPATSTG